jgi:dTDP-4-dehydrorhamnose reductase
MIANPTILITGATGMLGRVLLQMWRERFQVFAASRSRPVRHAMSWVGDLAAPGAAEALVATAKPDLVVHTAAFTDVDGCETDPDLAMKVNAEATGWLASAARRAGAAFVYISTEAVFDGVHGSYRESDRPHPVNQYGASKLAGEQEAQAAHGEAIIVRIGLEGWRSSGGPGFVQWVVEGLRRREQRTICTDWIHTVVFAANLAEILEKLWRAEEFGVYHVGAERPSSNWEIAHAAAEEFGLDKSLLVPIASDSLRLIAQRPRNVSLICERLQKRFGSVTWDLSRGLAEMKREEASGERGGALRTVLLARGTIS